MIFQGKLVKLRPLSVNDASLTLKWRQSERAKFLQRGAQSVEEQAKWIEKSLITGDISFIIEYKNTPVGMIALLDINDRHRSVQMGRLLIGEQDFIGNAPVFFETELLLCDYVFDVLKMHKIYGDIMEDNVGMLRTRYFLGYKRDGILRDHYIYDGIYKNTVAVSIIEDEYRSICRPKLIQLIDLFSITCEVKE